MTKREKQLAAAANRRKQRKQTRAYVSEAGLVSGGFRAGKRKRGNSLIKVAPSLSREGNIVKDQLQDILAVDPNAVMLGVRGHGRIVHYNRGK